MRLKALSACRYPTMVLMVDDNPRFLMHLAAKLDSAFHFKFETDPRNALSLMSKKSLLQETLRSCFVGEDSGLELDIQEDAVHQYYRSIHFGNLLKLLENPDRFNEVSVIVVDYAMPGMNGIELCRALSKHPARKILLTGEADHRIAVEAFNEGLIHRFVLKQTQENALYEELNAVISEMQNVYFSTSSRRLLSALDLDALASDALLVEEVNRIQAQYQNLEFYLMNSRGTFLLMDETGRPQIFLCESFKTLESYAQMAQENGASSVLQKALLEKTHLPCLFRAKNEDLNFQDWDQALVPIHLSTESGFFCALTNQAPYGFESMKIASYDRFIEKHLKEEMAFK